MITSRRSFLAGLVAAPTILKFGLWMPVKAQPILIVDASWLRGPMLIERDGLLLANGAMVERATYPELFAAIGTVYGGNSDGTRFRLPNLSSSPAPDPPPRKGPVLSHYLVPKTNKEGSLLIAGASVSRFE